MQARGLTGPLDDMLRGVDVPIWTPQAGPQAIAFKSTADVIGYGGAAGGGKRLDVDTPIATPSGWTTMGDLRVGDIVFSETGRPTVVTYTSPIEVAQRSFEVVFDTGEIIVADGDHLWHTMTDRDRDRAMRLCPEWRAQQRAKRPSRAVVMSQRPWVSKAITTINQNRAHQYMDPPTGCAKTTDEIAATLHVQNGTRINHSIQVPQSLSLPDATLPIEPYLFGLWLGDGYSRCGMIGMAEPDMREVLAGVTYPVLNEHSDIRPPRKIPFLSVSFAGLTAILRGLGVLNNKRIPTLYLRASREQRIALLQGLMDTDGYCDKRGQCEIALAKHDLITDCHELLSSLGIKATIHERETTCRGQRFTSWRIKFLAPFAAFRLKRKLDRQKVAGFRPTVNRRYIVAVQPCDPRPMRCIAVDAPSHLYLAGRSMIPTHNTDLALGLALRRHKRSLIMRREAKQLRAIIDRAREILGDTGSFNANTGVWRLPDGRQLEFGGCKDPGNEQGYRGRPHDLKFFDEADQFTEMMVLFISGWLRTTDPTQHCQILLAFNPPSTAEGEWLLNWFAPWLDEKHPNRAGPGEIRWFARVDDQDVEWPDNQPFTRNGKTIIPTSRTFIPAKLTDNAFLANTNYAATIDRLPEPLRSQLKYGDMTVGRKDDAWQVIPSVWVKAAMARWTPQRPLGADGRPVNLTCLGVDPARGGADATARAPRYRTWFDRVRKTPGTQTPDGPALSALVRRDLTELGNPRATVNIDVIGIGSSGYDFLRRDKANVVPIDFGWATERKDAAGVLEFANLRAWAYWALRELLDPNNPEPIALPPDKELLADLTAPRWQPSPSGIRVEKKEDIRKRIGRSPDCGDAVVYAALPVVPMVIGMPGQAASGGRGNNGNVLDDLPADTFGPPAGSSSRDAGQNFERSDRDQRPWPDSRVAGGVLDQRW